MPKEPLTQEEQDILLKAAREHGGFRYAPGSTPVNAHEVVLFFLDTGIHPSVLSDARFDLHTTRKGGKVYIEWQRPKKRGHAAFTRIRASSRISPWVEAFVLAPRPRFRQFYNALLRALAHDIAQKYGEYRGLGRNLSPLALRHTFAINRLDDGLNAELVRQMMNCSRKILAFYDKYRSDMIEAKLDEIGW